MPVYETPDEKAVMSDPRFIAGLELIRRNGARDIQLRYDDEQKPLVWVAVAEFSVVNGRPVEHGKINGYQVGGGLNPLLAVFSLCHACMDSKGVCVHCGKHTMFDETFTPQPLGDIYCWYQWDPETKTFRRGCE